MHENDINDYDEADFGKDDYQQELIQPKQIDLETQALID
jgi:hypothetical protein